MTEICAQLPSVASTCTVAPCFTFVTMDELVLGFDRTFRLDVLLDSFTVALTPSGAVVGGSVGCGSAVASGVAVGCSAITKYFFIT